MSTVSVLMPVYNSETFVAETIDSILAQTFGDFEFVIIDDGSTDGSLAILREYEKRDGRIRLISRPNTGYVRALNEGLEIAQGEFVARMDSDDISDKQRFELQVKFLREHPEVVAVGSNAFAMDAEGRRLGQYDVPLDNATIQRTLLGGDSCIHHPAVMMRTAAVRQLGGYNEQYMPCEDFDLWLRLGEIGELVNLPQPLLTKRLHPQSVVATKLQKMQRINEQLLADAWRRRGLQGQPNLQPRPLTRLVDLYRQWAWMALRDGQRSVARLYAWKQLLASPLSADSWRLAFCAIRGR